MTAIVLASNNQGKLQEFKKFFANSKVEFLLQSDFHIKNVSETGLTFVENAIFKARNASKFSKLPAIADDSGLIVDALNGAPGIYSARYAGNETNDQKNIAKLLSDMNNISEEKRSARFICVIVYLLKEDDPCPIICQGTWEGKIAFTPKGNNGFGYDSVFYIQDYNCTVAELPLTIKNTVSHRAKALQCLITEL